ncbi:hypothetical protein HOK021_40150 [Streptomyces hygroscopicus]|nr:hypothetical protein HOK021_40150 [Streptomyces hygroscopicus]
MSGLVPQWAQHTRPPFPEEPTVARSTTFRANTKQDTLTEHVVGFLHRVSRALRNLADSADHAAKMVRKADAARRS